jgi:hypothetical protein
MLEARNLRVLYRLITSPFPGIGELLKQLIQQAENLWL